MFESEMEQKINKAIEEGLSDERMNELGVLVTELLKDNVDGLPLAEVVVIKNFLEGALTQYVLDTAVSEGIITEEDIDNAYNSDPMEMLIGLIQDEMEKEELEGLDNADNADDEEEELVN